MSRNLTSQKLESEIYEVVKEEWPVNLTQIARHMDYEFDSKEEHKKVLAKLRYHFDKLVKEDKVNTKRIGRSLVVWPKEIEKLRVIHDLIS